MGTLEFDRQKSIDIANKTYRHKGSSVIDADGNIKSVTAKYVIENINPELKILDYGCGTYTVQRNFLRDKHGFKYIDVWDIGKNKPSDCVQVLDINAYDVVYASNVLNTMNTETMLRESILEIEHALKVNGVFIANYPKEPRKMDMTEKELESILNQYFSDVSIKRSDTGIKIYICKK